MDAGIGPSAASGRILVVCTGNVCRSPYVERVLAHALDGTDIVVSSAGTAALVGEPVDEQSAVRISKAGADPSGFTARQLSRTMIAEADLVICATRDHVDSVARAYPRALRYAFALTDLGHLLARVTEAEIIASPGANRIARVAAAAISKRPSVHPRPPDEAGIVDPFRREGSVFDQMVRQVARSLPAVVTALRGP